MACLYSRALYPFKNPGVKTFESQELAQWLTASEGTRLGAQMGLTPRAEAWVCTWHQPDFWKGLRQVGGVGMIRKGRGRLSKGPK